MRSNKTTHINFSSNKTTHGSYIYRLIYVYYSILLKHDLILCRIIDIAAILMPLYSFLNNIERYSREVDFS